MYFAHCWLNICCTIHVETRAAFEMTRFGCHQAAAALSLSRPQTELTFVKDFLFVSIAVQREGWCVYN